MIFFRLAKFLAWFGIFGSVAWFLYYFLFYVPADIQSTRQQLGGTDAIFVPRGSGGFSQTMLIFAGSVFLGMCAHVAEAILNHLKKGADA